MPSDVEMLAPRLTVDDVEYRVRLLDLSAVSASQLGETVASALSDREDILNTIDILLHGYPVGRPR
jgi:CcdB protein